MTSGNETVAKHLMRAAAMLIKYCNENHIAIQDRRTDYLLALGNALDIAEGAFEPWISNDEMLQEMEKDEEELTALTWGERCDEYEGECPVCVAWRLFDQNKRAPFDNEVADAIKEARK